VLLWAVTASSPVGATLDAMRWRDALLIGLAQVLRPRAGRVALGRDDHRRARAGLRPRLAAVFSFLMSMPITPRRRSRCPRGAGEKAELAAAAASRASSPPR
jgi:undecaprenyl pyrophosphate phosphatase UppP